MANELSLLDTVKERDRTDEQEHRREQQRLQDENRALRHELEEALLEKDRLARSVTNLRSTLNPMYRALRVIFGEIELAVGEETATASPVVHPGNHTSDPRWDNYKAQFTGVPAMVIDALLIHGSMGMTNLSALLRRAYGTTKNAAYKLKAAGAVTIDRGNVSLKR